MICRGFWPPTRRIGRRYKSESNGAVIYLRQNMVSMQNFSIFYWQLCIHVLPSSYFVAHFEPSVDVVGLLFSCLCIRELPEKQYQRYVYTYLHPHTYQCPFIHVCCTQKIQMYTLIRSLQLFANSSWSAVLGVAFVVPLCAAFSIPGVSRFMSIYQA